MATATVTVMAMKAMKTSEQSDLVNTLTDLHTHILPCMDDGAEDLDMALAMLRQQKKRGVERVALTSHFHPLREALDAFLQRRQQAFSTLLSRWDGKTMPSLRLGAEVRYTPELAQMDLRQLTIGQSDYLLLELPDAAVPAHVEQVAEGMLLQGVTPILAHVERCAYFRTEPYRLERLAQMGALAQVSCKAIKNPKDKGFAAACLQKGLAHVIASDAHNMGFKGPVLGSAQLDGDLICRAEEFARAVWENDRLPAYTIHSVKKGLLGYR